MSKDRVGVILVFKMTSILIFLQKEHVWRSRTVYRGSSLLIWIFLLSLDAKFPKSVSGREALLSTRSLESTYSENFL